MPRKPKVDTIPSHVGISTICAFTDTAARTVQTWATEGRIPKPEASGYPFMATVKAVIGCKAPSLQTSEMQDDKAAKLRAERITAELKAEESRGELLNRADIETIWSDAFTKIRVTIANALEIPETSRLKLIASLLALKLDTDDAS